MCYENDFIHRQIETVTRSLSVLLLRKDSKAALSRGFFTGGKNQISDDRLLEYALKRMADTGEINEAEMYLFDMLEDSPSRSKFLTAVEFYQHLNTLDDSFLQQSNFSREEIIDGLDAIKKMYEAVFE